MKLLIALGALVSVATPAQAQELLAPVPQSDTKRLPEVNCTLGYATSNWSQDVAVSTLADLVTAECSKLFPADKPCPSDVTGANCTRWQKLGHDARVNETKLLHELATKLVVAFRNGAR